MKAALATHPGVHDVGENAAFEGLASGEQGGDVFQPPGLGTPWGPMSVLRRSSCWVRVQARLRGIVAALDRCALAAGRRNWVGLISGSGAGLRSIQRILPGVRIVHVVRDGRDVVAAHVAEVAARRGRCVYADTAPAVAQWNRAVAWHARASERQGQVFVLFEDWAGAPQEKSRLLGHACGLPNEPPHSIDLSGEAKLPPVRAPRESLQQWFDGRQRQQLEATLHLERYGRVAERVRRFPVAGQYSSIG